MFYPTLKLKDIFLHRSHFYFDVVQIGAGGTGGYLTQRLSKLFYSLKGICPHVSYRYVIVDGDQVEEHNLQRQPFIVEDLDQTKSKILAERYGNAYDFPIFYRDQYVETKEDIIDCFQPDVNFFAQYVPILLGCVDNNATRQVMHEAFEYLPNMIYIDSGNDAVDIDANEQERCKTGYSGQVVCGARFNRKTYLSPVGEVYPNILEDKDTRLPTQACGEQVVYYPQRMQTNELAAVVINGYLNNLLFDHEIIAHYTNFNARTSLTRPVYLTSEQVKGGAKCLSR